MNQQKLRRRRSSYKARAIKLKNDVEQLVSEDAEDYIVKHKCEKLGDQLRTIKEVSEEICEVLETDEEAAKLMEETYELIDLCEDLMMKTFRKYDKNPAEKTAPTPHSRLDVVYRGVKRPELPVFRGDQREFENWRTMFDAFIGDEDLPGKHKMIQLKNCLAGEPLEIVAMYSPTDAGYAHAREELESKYGGTKRQVRFHLDDIRQARFVNAGATRDLEIFAKKVKALVCKLEEVGSSADLTEFSAYYVLLTEKLHMSYLTTYRRWLQTTGRNDGLNTFAQWLSDEASFEQEAREMSRPQNVTKCASSGDGNSQRKIRTTFVTKSGQTSRGQIRSCPCCNEDHFLENCTIFKAQPVRSRFELCKEQGICFRCLIGRHRGNNCRAFPGCKKPGCRGSHHSLLHSQRPAHVTDETHSSPATQEDGHDFEDEVRRGEEMGAKSENTTLNTLNLSGSPIQRSVTFQTVPVLIKSGSNALRVNAIIDPCSDATYLSEDAARELEIRTDMASVNLTTVKGHEEVQLKKGVIRISALDGEFQAETEAYVVKDLTGPTRAVNWTNIKDKWNHLADIQFPPVSRKGQIDLLIGMSEGMMPVFVPKECISGAAEEPIAVKTVLGWSAFGATPLGTSQDASQDANQASFYRSIKTLRTALSRSTNEAELAAIHAMTSLEMMGITQDGQPTSLEDQMALKKAAETLKVGESRYEIGVPWKKPRPELSGNFGPALSRLEKTERSLLRSQDESLPHKYDSILKSYIDKGYMTKMSYEEWKEHGADGWFLPHFPVIRNDKASTKVRIVYDAAAKFHGLSLNDEICPGPSMYNNITEVLIRFRRHQVALVGDVEEMFLQVELPEEDRKYHQILWRSFESERSPDVYQASRWLFGNAAAPFATQYVMQEHAKAHRSELPLAAETVLCSFYMDDALSSFESEAMAKEARLQLREMMSRAGMNIRKWMSNSEDVNASIPVEERAQETEKKIEDDMVTGVKTLGLYWSTREDSISLQVPSCEDMKITKRNCLKKMASIYDPLCLFAPFTITAKMLFQETWSCGLDWDDVMPEVLRAAWSKWLMDLLNLGVLQVPRCLHPLKNRVDRVSVHVFCDASEKAYAAAAYLVAECEDQRSSRLILSKARVTPRKKRETIPRLELVAAVLGLRLSKYLSGSMGIQMTEIHFWSDSLDVLCWIRNEVRKFQPFVANRIAEIREASSPAQWQHVPGNMNPADLPTRGLTIDELRDNPAWWQGPKFLLKDESSWPEKKDFLKEKYDRSELRKDADGRTFITRSAPMDGSFRLHPSRFSGWLRLVRVTAWVKRFISILKEKIGVKRASGSQAHQDEALHPEEIRAAERMWVKVAQQEKFGVELDLLEAAAKASDGQSAKRNKTLKTSSIFQLHPQLDEDGFIRVGGRLQRSNLPFDTRHPLLLPKEHAVTKLIVRHMHEEPGHELGVEHTLAELRQRFWIVAGREAVKRCIKQCIVCQKRRKAPLAQIMAPKLEAQVRPSYRAFEKCAVDYSGPFETRQGRGKARQKRYICLFTCLQTRAIHLEVAHGLDTDAFLRAFLRFTARRGNPSEIWSDNGTNFVGAAKELKALVKSQDPAKIQEKTAHLQIKWHFNPPGAPHFGGAYEIMVKMVKRALKPVLSSAEIRDEELLTAVCRVEGMLNSRPLTALSADPLDLTPLTPGHFLGLVSTELPQSASGQEASQALRYRWRRVQQLSTEYWKRWIREYLPSLQARSKWREVQPDIQDGELVLVVDNQAPRSEWPLGRVMQVFRGADGHVRAATVRMKGKTVTRPVVKIVRLEVAGPSPA